MRCFVVLSCAAPNKSGCGTGQQFDGLAIGFIIMAGGYGAGAVSDGRFIPALAPGLDVSSASQGIKCFGIVDACLAAGLFRVVRPNGFGGSPDSACTCGASASSSAPTSAQGRSWRTSARAFHTLACS